MVQEPDFLQEKTKREHKGVKLTPGTIVLIVGIVVFISVLGIQLFQQNQLQPVAGERAPNFTITTYDGETIDSRDLRGQIVIVNMWASWCGPCHAEADDFQQIHEDYASDGVVLLGVNWLDIDDEAFEFIEFYDLTYPNAPDIGERVYEAFNVQGMPETFVIGPDGIVRATFLGGTTYEALSNVLNEVLAEDAS
ncbi:MAG: TlpA disulfide reductase family protein [Chloroflexota bacterium]